MIAKHIYDVIADTELEKKLILVGSDGTATMTGHTNGCIAQLEQMLHQSLQWAICLLHCNELLHRHVFSALHGITLSPDAFSGQIGKKLSSPNFVADLPVKKFRPIPNPNFPLIPNEVLEDLRSDQHYAYKICWALC